MNLLLYWNEYTNSIFGAHLVIKPLLKMMTMIIVGVKPSFNIISVIPGPTHVVGLYKELHDQTYRHDNHGKVNKERWYNSPGCSPIFEIHLRPFYFRRFKTYFSEI